MITTRLHKLDIQDIEQNVAHIFEHIVIHGFRQFLTKNGLNSDLFGWIDGETFEDLIFIRGGFYRSSTAELFDTYIKTNHLYTDSEILHAIKVVENEDKISLSYNIDELRKEIVHLSNRSWGQVNNNNKRNNKFLLSQIDGDTFNDVTLSIYAYNLSQSEKKLFLRTRTILIDIINNFLYDQISAYTRGSSSLYIEKELSGYISIYTINDKDLDIKKIQKDCKKQLSLFNVHEYYHDIYEQFTTSADEQLLQFAPLDYYRETGLITTNDEIMKLATESNISSLISKIDVVVRNTIKTDLRHI